MPSEYRLLIIGLAVCVSIGCKDGQSKALLALDRGPQPTLRLLISTPSYAQTSVRPDTSISITISTYTTSIDSARQWVSQNAVIEAYATHTPVQGKWTWVSISDVVTFQPNVALADGDYLVHFPKATKDQVVKPRPYNLFRVGSALRLAEVDLLREKPGSSSDLTNIQLGFSEQPAATESMDLKVEQEAGTSSWSTVSYQMNGQTAAHVSKPIDPNVRLRLTLSSPSLDSQWNGTVGSGPLVVEFLPKDYLIEDGQVAYYVPFPGIGGTP